MFGSVVWQKTLSIVDAEFPEQYSGQFGLFIALSIFRKACEIVPLQRLYIGARSLQVKGRLSELMAVGQDNQIGEVVVF